MPIMASGRAAIALDTLTIRPQFRFNMVGRNANGQGRRRYQIDGKRARPLGRVDVASGTKRGHHGGIVNEDVDRPKYLIGLVNGFSNIFNDG